MSEERQIICSATTDKAEEGPQAGKYRLNVVAAGWVSAPLPDAWRIIREFETLPQVDDRFQEVRYFPENQRLFLHLVAYGYHAQMILQLRFGESEHAREMHFESVEGSYKGMTGVVRIEDVKNQKTEIAMTTDYASETIPLPKVLMGIGVEIVGSRVAAAMRTFIEAKYNETKNTDKKTNIKK